MNPVSIDALRKLAGTAPESVHPSTNGHSIPKGGSTNPHTEAYGKAALERELSKLQSATVGNRNNQLNDSAFALGQLVAGGVLNETEVTSELGRAASAIGLDRAEIKSTIQSGLEAGMREPRGVPDTGPRQEAPKQGMPYRTPQPEQQSAKQEGAPSGGIPGLVCLADVQPEHVLWLWPGRIPLGKLTILDGDPGLGKSMITCDLAARVSTGAPMPDGEMGDVDGPAGVVLLSAEDGLADTIRPRLDAAHADVTRIAALTFVVDETGLMKTPSVADLQDLERAIAATEAKLIVVDPIMAYLPEKTKSHNDQDVRRVLAPLADLAERTGVAVLMLRHLNKAPGGNPLYRGGGSIAFIGAVRSGLLAAQDPEDDTGLRRIIASTKSNLAVAPQALAYHVATSDNGAARVIWEGVTGHTAASLLTVVDMDDQSAMADATAFLKDLLEDGECPAVEVDKKAKAAGIAKRTLDRAKGKLGVLSQKRGAITDAYWAWVLPEEKK